MLNYRFKSPITRHTRLTVKYKTKKIFFNVCFFPNYTYKYLQYKKILLVKVTEIWKSVNSVDVIYHSWVSKKQMNYNWHFDKIVKPNPVTPTFPSHPMNAQTSLYGSDLQHPCTVNRRSTTFSRSRFWIIDSINLFSRTGRHYNKFT